MNELFLFGIAFVIALVGVTTGNYWLVLLAGLLALMGWHLA